MAQPQHWQPEPLERPRALQAQLNYLAHTGERPVTYARSLSSGGRVDGPLAEPHRVRIENARLLLASNRISLPWASRLLEVCPPQSMALPRK